MRSLRAAVAAVTLAACGLLPAQAPDWVVNRVPLESCGEEEVDFGAGGFDEAARRCLLAAFEEGAAAELTSTATSVEGDPITRIVRVHEDGSVEVLVDATRDRFGSGEWERLRCARLLPVDEYNDLMGSQLPAELVFVEDGCAPVSE